MRQRELWLLFAILLLAIVLHHATFISMAQIWLRSQTFVHGILIVPIVIYLLWRRWPKLRSIDLEPWYPGLGLLLCATVGWWISDLLSLQVGKQFMAVAMLPLLVLTLAGTAFTRAIAFPLGYLIFAVPFGEGAIPYLIEFTATFTVKALEITGFPVYRQGPFFSIPAGDFEVAKACSGIRYLLASLALGTLYGYLIFTSFKKRLGFFLFALLLPIAANGLRAYGIVLLAHYSGMQLAVGVDHIIFGWIFFGLVMALMFWVGDFYRDKPLTEVAMEQERGSDRQGADSSLRRFGPATAFALLVVAAGPALPLVLAPPDPGLAPAGLPMQVERWRATDLPSDWHPDYENPSFSVQRRYLRDGAYVDLAVIRYDLQTQDAELANADNDVASRATWRFGQISERELRPGDGVPRPLRETIIHSGTGSRIVWSVAEVNGTPVTSDMETKWQEALSLLDNRAPVSAAIIASVPLGREAGAAREVLSDFMTEAWQSIHACLYADGSESSACTRDTERAIDMRNEEAEPDL